MILMEQLVLAAPLDLSTIDKYKEAGYRTIATNMEIWDENYFKTICPGKEEICGEEKIGLML